MAARASAQQIKRMRSVGVLMTFGADEAIGHTRVAALLQGLQQAGWEVGRNLRIELRWSGANPGDVRKHAGELAALARHSALMSLLRQDGDARVSQATRIPFTNLIRLNRPCTEKFRSARSASARTRPEGAPASLFARVTTGVWCEPRCAHWRGTRITARVAAGQFLSATAPSVGGAPPSAGRSPPFGP